MIRFDPYPMKKLYKLFTNRIDLQSSAKSIGENGGHL